MNQSDAERLFDAYLGQGLKLDACPVACVYASKLELALWLSQFSHACAMARK